MTMTMTMVGGVKLSISPPTKYDTADQGDTEYKVRWLILTGISILKNLNFRDILPYFILYL
jgi:hypothetical protein